MVEFIFFSLLPVKVFSGRAGTSMEGSQRRDHSDSVWMQYFHKAPENGLLKWSVVLKIDIFNDEIIAN